MSAPAVSLGTLAEKHGGVVDEKARPRLSQGIAPLDAGAASDLCPFTWRRHLPLVLVSQAALLVDEKLPSLVPMGRRWIHPHAAWALSGVLSDLEPKDEPRRSDRALVDGAPE